MPCPISGAKRLWTLHCISWKSHQERVCSGAGLGQKQGETPPKIPASQPKGPGTSPKTDAVPYWEGFCLGGDYGPFIFASVQLPEGGSMILLSWIWRCSLSCDVLQEDQKSNSVSRVESQPWRIYSRDPLTLIPWYVLSYRMSCSLFLQSRPCWLHGTSIMYFLCYRSLWAHPG